MDVIDEEKCDRIDEETFDLIDEEKFELICQEVVLSCKTLALPSGGTSRPLVPTLP